VLAITFCVVSASTEACGPNGGGNPDSGDSGSILGNMLPDAQLNMPDASPECPSVYQQVDAVLQEDVTCVRDNRECQIETLSCPVVGACWAIVNTNVRSALNTLIETLSADNCSVPASQCQCAPMPSGVSCVQGLCVANMPDAGPGDAGPDGGGDG
jgi:hypothetical protein